MSGIVYIITNPSFDKWVKIGSTEQTIEKRLAGLNRQAVPYSFVPYATYEVPNPKVVEKEIQGLIDDFNPALRAIEPREGGRPRKREFYLMSPQGAYAMFERVARMRGDNHKLKRIATTPEQEAEERLAEEVITRSRRDNFSFGMVGILPGAKLVYTGSIKRTCKVVDDRRVEYQRERGYLSGFAERFLIEEGRSAGSNGVNGFLHFSYEGRLLSDIRKEIAAEE